MASDAWAAFAPRSVLAMLSCRHGISYLDRDICWLYDRWTYPRNLGWRHDLLFGRTAQWCRCLCGVVARVASVKVTMGLKAK